MSILLSYKYKKYKGRRKVSGMSKLAEGKVERDPSGKSPHSAGAKLDDGKLRPQLVLGPFARALEEVVRVGTAGAKKYTDDGWQSVDNAIQRYSDAARRHQLEVDKGITFDHTMDDYIPAGSMSVRHKAQVIWNLLAVLELELRGEE